MADDHHVHEMASFTGKQDIVAESHSSHSHDDPSLMTKDEQLLAHFGKRQKMKRNFGLLAILGLSSTLMLTWEGALIGIQPTILNGGTRGAIISYPIIVFGVFCQVLVNAELSSMMPLSGGQYNWVAILAPNSMSNFLSYLTGWVLFIAWQASCASVSWLGANLILALANLNFPQYEIKIWHAVLVVYAMVALGLLVNTYLGRVFPTIEAIVLIIHVVAFFIILIVMLYLAPKQPASEVFGTFINGGEFSSNGMSALVGAVSIMFGFNGSDAATHIAEEIENAATAIPRAMILSIIINGVVGYSMLIAFFFCMGPLMNVLSSHLSFPFVEVFLNITGSTKSTTAIASVMLVLVIAGSFGLLATASRMMWAFSREGGMPASKYLSRVETRTALPLYAIGTTALITLLLSLIGLGSITIFNALSGLTVAGFYSAFCLAAGSMLWRRLTLPESSINWGPFRLGKLGVPITIIALIFSIVGWIFSFWPIFAHVTILNFNFGLVIYFGTIFLAIAWWFIRARKTYTGPKMEITPTQWQGELFNSMKRD